MAARETILLFDSGLGGLTVYREVVVARPRADYIYVADDAGFPYGALAEPVLVERVVGLMGDLIEAHRPDLVVIPCNTASTIVLPDLRKHFTVPANWNHGQVSIFGKSDAWPVSLNRFTARKLFGKPSAMPEPPVISNRSEHASPST